MKRFSRILAVASLAFSVTTVGAFADACSGRSHPEGTILGGVGGGVIGGAVTHGSAGGVIGGAVLGGLAGNAIARDRDCHRYRYYRHARYYRHDRDGYYDRDGDYHRYSEGYYDRDGRYHRDGY